MREYISIKDCLDIVSQYCPDDDGSCSKADVDLRTMLDEIEALPAADVQPVKHGKWLKRMSTSDSLKCSICGNNHEYITTYCPNCGARMDGDKNG